MHDCPWCGTALKAMRAVGLDFSSRLTFTLVMIAPFFLIDLAGGISDQLTSPGTFLKEDAIVVAVATAIRFLACYALWVPAILHAAHGGAPGLKGILATALSVPAVAAAGPGVYLVLHRLMR